MWKIFIFRMTHIYSPSELHTICSLQIIKRYVNFWAVTKVYFVAIFLPFDSIPWFKILVPKVESLDVLWHWYWLSGQDLYHSLYVFYRTACKCIKTFCLFPASDLEKISILTCGLCEHVGQVFSACKPISLDRMQSSRSQCRGINVF